MSHTHDVQQLIEEGNYLDAINLSKTQAINILQTAAMVATKLGDHEEVIHLSNLCVSLQPNNAQVYGNLSFFLGNLMYLEEALEAIDKAIQLQHDFPQFHYNRGVILSGLKRIPEAIACYRHIILNEPDCHFAKFNLGCLLMLDGQYKEGLQLLETRFYEDSKVNQFKRRFDKPDWNGELKPGTRLLLYTEQGCGDTVQFCRYLKYIPDDFYTIAEMHEELAPLVEHMFDEVVPRSATYNIEEKPNLPDHDYIVAFSSLAYLLDPELKNIPTQPYLDPTPGTPIDLDQFKLNVGIVWAGNPNHGNDSNRSMTAKDIAPLAHLKDVQLYSLQKGEQHRTIHGREVDIREGFENLGIIDLQDLLTDFLKTAQVIQQLDVIVSVDTSVAHIAAAMGKTTLIMLPFAQDHRWTIGKEVPIWYPSARLFIQDKPTNWSNVVQQVALELVAYKNMYLSPLQIYQD